MAKMVITHKVEDIEKWLKGKVERAKAITQLGGKNVVDHVATDGKQQRCRLPPTSAIPLGHDDGDRLAVPGAQCSDGEPRRRPTADASRRK